MKYCKFWVRYIIIRNGRVAGFNINIEHFLFLEVWEVRSQVTESRANLLVTLEKLNPVLLTSLSTVKRV